MQTIAKDMAQMNLVGPQSANVNIQPNLELPPITQEHVDMWINQLEQWTNIFYNEAGASNQALWQEAQQKLLQFQKIHNPFELCTEIVKKSRNPLVLYQATLCLKNAVANNFKKLDLDESFKLFQFLYEFLCSQALENEMSVNETTALICAMILKRLASEKTDNLSTMAMLAAHYGQRPTPSGHKEADRITQVVSLLCQNIKDPNESLSKKLASSLMLSSLLHECQMTYRSTLLSIIVWKHLNARKHIENHIKFISEACLETINWAFTSNLLNPANQTRETQYFFHFVGSLIQCVEYSLSLNSTDTSCSPGGDRVLRLIQSRTILMINQAGENDQLHRTRKEWCNFIMSPSVVQFLFNLYTTIRSMVNIAPGWEWPTNALKSCLNCLYYLSDVHNSIIVERDNTYIEFVGNFMLGTVKIMDAEARGLDDSFTIACLITSIAMHTGETRDTLTRLKCEHFIPFMDAAQRFTCKVFAQVASTTTVDEEEEEEKTVDALLDFWYHILRSIEYEIRAVVSTSPPQTPKINTDGMKAYSRSIVESYISCHLHKPLGQLVPKIDCDIQEVDLDQAEEHDDSNIHALQLVSFGNLARFDALHTAKLLVELLGTRLGHYEALLAQFFNTTDSPDGLKDWEYINDDLHWLLLMLQYYLTQTGYGELGFMCNEILMASVRYEADTKKTLQAFEKFDYSSPDVDPMVRLIIMTLKLCQLEMGICQSGKFSWLSVQTHTTLTTLLSRFCLTYLFPKESDYTVISENMNNCFGQDAPTAEKFAKFVIEHACCVIMCMKSDPQVVKKNVLLLMQMLVYHPNIKSIMAKAEDGSMIKTFVSQMRPDNLGGFSPRVAKSIIKLATRLFVEEDDWNKLIEFFTNKWAFIMSCIQNQQHQYEMVSSKFLEFCDFAIGVCEACDDESSERLFSQLLVPIVEAMPSVLRAFANFETVPVAVFELLYFIAKLPMINIDTWESESAKSFYDNCNVILQTYAQIASTKKHRKEEEDCEDIIAVLTFSHEIMKRDWGNTWTNCETVVKFSMEKISSLMKPEYLQFPRIRTLYYRLLVYLVDEDDRLANLSDNLLNTIVSSILLTLQSQFDKDVDNHTYTIIGIICRAIFIEKGTPVSERLSKFMMPVLPALFQSIIGQGNFTINTETAELVAPALFSLRCCFINLYQSLVNDLIEKQEDPFVKAKVRSLFEGLESKIHKLTLNRAACREFITLFTPFLAELHNYIIYK